MSYGFFLDSISNSLESFFSSFKRSWSTLTDSKSDIPLKKVDSDVKIYKNTLVRRALSDNGITMDEYLEGPNAIVFGKDLLEPIKIISKFAKDHKNIEIVGGMINGEVVDLSTINEYASIPSYEGLLTMFAGGLMEHLKNLSIALNLYADKLGEEK